MRLGQKQIDFYSCGQILLVKKFCKNLVFKPIGWRECVGRILAMHIYKERTNFIVKSPKRLELGLLYGFGLSFLLHLVLFGAEWHRDSSHAPNIAKGLRAQLTQKTAVDVPTAKAKPEKAQAAETKQDVSAAPVGSLNPVTAVGTRSPWRRQADGVVAEGLKAAREDALLQQSRQRERLNQQEQWLRFNAEETLMKRLASVQVSGRCEVMLLVGADPVFECASADDVRKLKIVLRDMGPLIAARGFPDVSIFVLTPGEGISRSSPSLK